MESGDLSNTISGVFLASFSKLQLERFCSPQSKLEPVVEVIKDLIIS